MSTLILEIVRVLLGGHPTMTREEVLTEVDVSDSEASKIRQAVEEQLESNSMVLDGFEEALLGVSASDGTAVYDKSKCIEILMRKNSWSEESSMEFFEYNVINIKVSGATTPIFVENL
jgi:hypothetical protein